MRIAVLIPVYLEPKALVSICEQLASDPFPDKEIVVVVDGEVTPAIELAFGKIAALSGLRIVSGRGHLGKAEALNRATLEASADALLFLDNDIFLPQKPDFLADLASALEARDLVELPKVGVGRGFLAAMMKIEFLVSIYSAESMALNLGACPSMNGAAFAIRKPLFDSLGGFRGTVNEDMDLAARAFFKGATFGFPARLSVGNAVSERPAEWLRQRKRWMLNNAEWSRLYALPSLKSKPDAIRAILHTGLRRAMPWLALLAGAYSAGLIAMALRSSVLWLFASAVLGGGGTWALSSIAYERCARRFGAEFDLGAFLAYTIIYKPLLALVELARGIPVAAGSKPKVDWTCASSRDEEVQYQNGSAARAMRFVPAMERDRRRAVLRRGR